MNFPTTFAKVKIFLFNSTKDWVEYENCQMIITGNYLIINLEPVRPTERIKEITSKVYEMGQVLSYTTTTHLPEDNKKLIID